MKDKVRNIFPGGNTPKGFFSYYNYILPQRKAEKIFCIKGGPGVGKSTLMKSIAGHFAAKGETVDLFRCSSDPDSLDGVLLKERAVCIVDGTAPHIVDPKNPGAVDEIVNLGTMWDVRALRKHREQIMSCNDKIADIFQMVYGYLMCADSQYQFMGKLMQRLISPAEIHEMIMVIDDAFDKTDALRSMKCRDTDCTGREKKNRYGERKKAFASAITPAGLKNGLDTIIKDADHKIIVDAPAGFRTGTLMFNIADRLAGAGYNIEEYYCPMDPETGLEHVYCPELSLAAVTSNQYHRINTETKERHITRISVDTVKEEKEETLNILRDLQEESRKNISKAVALLETAKKQHDSLEEYYITNMNFTKAEQVKQDMIEEIESIGYVSHM